jgi:hypothetical protein
MMGLDSFSSPAPKCEQALAATSGPGPARYLAAVLMALLLAGCKGGEETSALPDTSQPATAANYNGPPPATEDVQDFKRSVWDNLVSDNRCGACHSTGGQLPQFVHAGDINTAYAEAKSIVNLVEPDESLMVRRVAADHNCWLSSNSACADTLTNFISNWAGDSGGELRTVDLRAPAIKEPGASKTFPQNSSAFGDTVYPLLRTYCAECHVEGIQTPFASSDVDIAYNESRSRMNLQNPASSRFVERLRDEFHNCWDGDCASAAEQMQVAVAFLADTVDAQQLDSELVASKALTLTADGLLANSGGRFEDNIIALYEFKTGEGNTAFDTSGVEPALHLTLTGNVDWLGGWGLTFGAAYTDEESGTLVGNGKAQGRTATSKKLHDLLTASGEYTLEAWVVPANTSQEDARIVTYSGSAMARNVTLSQFQQNYEVLHRSSTSDQNSAFATADGDTRLQASLQHVAVTFSASGGRKIYVNGEFTGDIDPDGPGLLNEWDDSFALVLGNETDGNSLWQGSLRMVAFHNRALDPTRIRTNFEAGVGQNFFLLFSVSHLIDLPDSFVVFEVSQFDNFSYLFSSPFFISLDDSRSPQGIPLKGIRIGVNGKEAGVGQSFANVDLVLDSTGYQPGSGQRISDQGAIIALETGPDSDEFFLSFERLGDNENVVVEAPPGPLPQTPDRPASPTIGLKTFDEINASMAQVSTIPATRPEVAETFRLVRQQLPSVENIGGFLSSQQMAVTQMAIQYCDVLVADADKRASFFPGFDFNASVPAAFDATGRTLIIDNLINRMVGPGLSSQPSNSALAEELNNLMDTLTSCGGACAAGRTETVVKASCAAVLGSAVMLVQ